MSKLPEITVSASGYKLPEAWLQFKFKGHPSPGVYVVVPKEKLTSEALLRVIERIFPSSHSNRRSAPALTDAILAHLRGGE